MDILLSWGDDRPCNMEGTCTVQIKMFDGMV